MSEIFNLL